jgi:hypothetical protein
MMAMGMGGMMMQMMMGKVAMIAMKALVIGKIALILSGIMALKVKIDPPPPRGLIEGTVTSKVSSSRNRREKEDRIGESQPFRERTLSVQDKSFT